MKIREIEIILDWNGTSIELWKNASHKDCITIIDNNDLKIKLLNIPTVLKRAISQCANCTVLEKE